MTRRLDAVRRSLLSSLCAAVVGCCPPPGEAEKHVLSAFDAYRRHDAHGVEAALSSEGRANGRRLCSGSAIHCLESNYDSRGAFVSRGAQCVGRGEDGYGVVLRTGWRLHATAEPEFLCQHFSLDAGRERYRIDSFQEPAPCS
jgi:hypothetical protein